MTPVAKLETAPLNSSEEILRSVLIEADKKINLLRDQLLELKAKYEEEVRSSVCFKERNIELIGEKETLVEKICQEAEIQKRIFDTIKSHAQMLAADSPLIKELGLFEKSRSIEDKEKQIIFIIEHSRKLKIEFFELKIKLKKERQEQQTENRLTEAFFTHFTTGAIATSCAFLASQQAGVAVGILVGGPVGAVAGVTLSAAILGVKALITSPASKALKDK